MSVTISPPMFLQFLNPNNTGSPSVGFKLFTYQTGTSIKQATWTDSTQSVQNANPLLLDGNGVAAATSSSGIWGDPSLTYKFVWALSTDTDPPGSPIRTIDGITFPVSTSFILSFLQTITTVPILASYARTAAEISAGVTPVNYAYAPGDVRRYGAKCDGSTNDTVSINAALTCNNSVWITGTSVASGIKMLSDGQVLYGVGRNSGIIALNNTTPCILLSANRQVVQDLFLSTGALGNNDTDSYTITNITQATSAVVTINTVSLSNPVAAGQSVGIFNVVGMTQINGQQPATVTAVGGVSGAWTFTLNINSLAFTAYSSGGNAVTTGYSGILLQGSTRSLIQRIATSGNWSWAIDLEGAIYSTVTYCNIDGFRKRGINIYGGGDCRVLFNMVFDSSLAAPTDAHIYMAQAAAIHVRDNLITRTSSTGGPGVFALNITGSFLGQLLWITDNVIDNGQNWAIQVNGVWDLHILGNWCSWGQSSGNTGQISVTNSQKFYIRDNDVYGSLQQGVGIAVTTSNNGTVSGNTIEYNYNNVVVTNCSNMVISNNVSGQLTGLPSSGVPTQNSYVESGCSAGCQITWSDNIAYLPVVAAYSGITNTVVAGAGYTNQSFNVQTVNYTLILTDRNGQVLMNSGTAKSLTIPSGVGFVAGDKVTVISGQATVANTIVPGAGITLLFANGTNTSGTRTLTGVGYTVLEFITPTVVIASAGSGLT